MHIVRLKISGFRGVRAAEILLGRHAVLVGTGSRPVRLGDVQAPGKRRMTAPDWARGLRSDYGHECSQQGRRGEQSATHATQAVNGHDQGDPSRCHGRSRQTLHQDGDLANRSKAARTRDKRNGDEPTIPNDLT